MNRRGVLKSLAAIPGLLLARRGLAYGVAPGGAEDLGWREQCAVFRTTIPATSLVKPELFGLFKFPPTAKLLSLSVTPSAMDSNAWPTLRFRCVVGGDPNKRVAVTMDSDYAQYAGGAVNENPRFRGYDCGGKGLYWETVTSAGTAVVGTVDVMVRWLEKRRG